MENFLLCPPPPSQPETAEISLEATPVPLLRLCLPKRACPLSFPQPLWGSPSQQFPCWSVCLTVIGLGFLGGIVLQSLFLEIYWMEMHTLVTCSAKKKIKFCKCRVNQSTLIPRSPG